MHSNWEFADVFYDFGISGTKTDARDGLQALMYECRIGRIDYILTKSISRFSRNTTDCLSLVRELLDLNIAIYFEKENIDTGSMESELVLSILSSMAQDESKSISENNKWAVKKRFEQGTYKFSYLPYGYMHDKNGNMIINSDEADVIKNIFRYALNGVGTYKIAKLFQEQGVPTRRGGQWTGSTVKSILTNEKYYGAAIFQKTYTDENYHRSRNCGDVDSFFDPEHHEPIISKSTFDRAREIIKQRASEKKLIQGDVKYQQRYAFSGKVFCGECGGKFKRKIHDSGKEIAWSCSTHIRNIEKCSMKYVRDDRLKAAFVNMMNKLIYSRKRLLLPLHEAINTQESDKNVNRIHFLQAELQKISDKKETLRKLRATDIIDSIVFNQEMNRLENLSEEYRNEIGGLYNENSDYTELKNLIQFTDREMLTEFNDEIFEKFISEVVIINRNMAEFHLKCGLKLKENL